MPHSSSLSPLLLLFAEFVSVNPRFAVCFLMALCLGCFGCILFASLSIVASLVAVAIAIVGASEVFGSAECSDCRDRFRHIAHRSLPNKRRI